MPRGDRTGPRGLGSRTGRRLGLCSGYSSPGYTKGPGMGMGWGQRRGYGRRWGGYNPEPYYTETISPDERIPVKEDILQESKYLEKVLEDLREETKAIEKRLIDLGKKK